MSEWSGQERRGDSHEMISLLSNMDKNLALAVQDAKHRTELFDAHIKEDKAIQGSLQKSVDDIKLKIAQWVGGGAVVMVIGQIALKAIWK